MKVHAVLVAELEQLRLASPKLELNEASLPAAIRNERYLIAFCRNCTLLFFFFEGQRNVISGEGTIPLKDLLLTSRVISYKLFEKCLIQGFWKVVLSSLWNTFPSSIPDTAAFARLNPQGEPSRSFL